MTYNDLRAEFFRRIKLGQRFSSFAQTADFSNRAAEVLGQLLSENIADIDDPEELFDRLLREYYKHLNAILSDTQQAIDEKNGLGLRALQAAYPAERAAQIASSLVDPTADEEKIKRRARSATENLARSFHDDFIRENAKFRSKAGIKAYIIRTAVGKCCAWCEGLAGRYAYGTEPHDVYRRHDNCTCTVIYESGRERQDVWSKKVTAIKPYVPARFTRDQAQAWQDEQLGKLRLDISAESGIIKSNEAKALDLFNDYGLPSEAHITAEQILNDLNNTEIGRQTIKDIENLPRRITLSYENKSNGVRGEEYNGEIVIYLKNCKNPLWAARTVIHEITHYKYGIGQSQWAESVCVAQELKHARGRNTLTISELRMIVKAVKDAYPEFNWRKGGIINGKRVR